MKESDQITDSDFDPCGLKPESFDVKHSNKCYGEPAQEKAEKLYETTLGKLPLYEYLEKDLYYNIKINPQMRLWLRKLCFRLRLIYHNWCTENLIPNMTPTQIESEEQRIRADSVQDVVQRNPKRIAQGCVATNSWIWEQEEREVDDDFFIRVRRPPVIPRKEEDIVELDVAKHFLPIYLMNTVWQHYDRERSDIHNLVREAKQDYREDNTTPLC